MPRTHKREFFYKYMTSRTAKTVLSNFSFRWSSPLLFNDPFDHQIDFNFDFTSSEFEEKYMKVIEETIFGANEVFFEKSNKISIVNSNLRENSHQLNKNDTLREIKLSISDTIKYLDKFKDGINAELQRHLSVLRVLCLSETNDNVVMWSHYADNHKGVVIKLKCVDEIDSNLLSAREIKYRRNLPVIASLDNMVKNTIGLRKFDYPDLFTDLSCIKHGDWEYEREWRLVIPEDETNTNLYNDYKEDPVVFGAIYMGCRIEPEDESDILDLLVGPLAHVEVYRAIKRKVEFGLDFERVR